MNITLFNKINICIRRKYTPHFQIGFLHNCGMLIYSKEEWESHKCLWKFDKWNLFIGDQIKKGKEIFTVVEDENDEGKKELWLRDFHTVYPGGSGLWCSKLDDFDFTGWHIIRKEK